MFVPLHSGSRSRGAVGPVNGGEGAGMPGPSALHCVPEHVQPMRLLLSLLAVAPSRSGLYRGLWRPLLFTLVLAGTGALSWAALLDTRFPKALIVGTAGLSLASVAGWLSLAHYLGSGHSRASAGFLLSLAEGRMRLRLRSTTRVYAFGALLASVVLSVGWLAVSWMAVSGIDNNDGVDDDPDSSMPIFYILYAVAVPVNVTVFVFAVAVAALMAHISRAQVAALAVSMEDGTLSMERVVRKHATMARLARRLSSLMQSFVVPVFIIFPLSISYQLWDAARASERADNELNGKYYLVIYALALILVATIFTSINRKFSSLTDTAAQLHRVGSHSFTDINTLLGYLVASRPPFLIMGAAPSPAIVPILILAFFGVVGTLIHQVSL
ncbi:uncharacterized protein AMSG_02477, partial [Thecamonas trahens ATCC 50062]